MHVVVKAGFSVAELYWNFSQIEKPIFSFNFLLYSCLSLDSSFSFK